MNLTSAVHRRLLSLIIWVGILAFCTGCQTGYIVSSAYHQIKILSARQPIEHLLKKDDLSEDVKQKLRLVMDAKDFSIRKLGLDENRNYTSYVHLDRDAVSYVLQAAPVNKLEAHLWKFPIVGAVPYKGFFTLKAAEEERHLFPRDKFDTYIRGVSAYSTLGWFNDPVLSPMLRYSDHDLVELILHENVHATIYLKGEADFNERLATFFGIEGVKAYYREKEGEKSATLRRIELEGGDQKLFSSFISKELDLLKKWYEEKNGDFSAEEKRARLKLIQTRFQKELKPKLRTDLFDGFSSRELNNASLLVFQTYFYDLSDFEKVFAKFGKDFHKTLEYCKSLESSDDPERELKAFADSR